MRRFWSGPALAHFLRLPPTEARAAVPASREATRAKPLRLRHFTKVSSLVGLLATTVAPNASAAPEGTNPVIHTKNVRHSALTAPAQTLELGVFSSSRYAVNEHLELSLHPLGFLLWPQLEAKIRWFDVGSFTFSTLHSLSYPAWFLDVVARQGTGGLIDPNADIPVTFQTDLGLLATLRLGPNAWATVQPFAQVGLGKDTPLLEFPFLYQRLAAATAGYTLGVSAALEGLIGRAVAYEVSAAYTALPLDRVEGAFAVETVMEARLLVSESSSVPLGVRFAHARFPYGRRSHWFPYLDYRVVW